MEPIERMPLREEIHARLLQSLVKGEFGPGSKVRDTEVAARLGISRTPAREALLRLEQEGFLESRQGRGFTVRPLDRREIEELYPIIRQLETLALREAPRPSPESLAELRGLADGIGAPGTPPLRRLELDAVWHARLVEGCGNTRLLDMIARLKTLIERYLHAYILLKPRIAPSVDEHARILDRLEADDRAGAEALLAAHWTRHLDVMRELFEEASE